ncbi:cytochrome p450 [Moniliophthora roreri MCA 2997]|uniref:Cytochrome p450 n=1 Tax=Moniliophthora roreri (strain MCA 2997) TaxID=1381753 RepID=V2XQ83_MONRO|nr:cytochrome p450 [Moniliophthora roreri MCA 2997]
MTFDRASNGHRITSDRHRMALNNIDAHLVGPHRLLGSNLSDIPVKKPWLTYAGWAKQYGDVMHLQMSGDHIVLLSSVKAANDLLDKRSRIYSGRGNEDVVKTTRWYFNMAFQNYGETWRKNRRIYQQHFRPDAVATRLRPSIEKCIGVFLRNLFDTPERFMDHIDICVHCHALPLRQVRSLGPTRTINNARKDLHDLREIPVELIRRNIESNVENDGLLAQVMREKLEDDNSAEEIEAIKDMAAIAFSASADTTLSSTGTFFLAMARNPEVQYKAQQEIDSDRKRPSTRS